MAEAAKSSFFWIGQVLLLLVSGTMGSLGLVGLIDRVFGWNSLEAINSTIYSLILRLVGWWDFAVIGTTSFIVEKSGLEAETNTIAASAAMVLISAVGTKHFQNRFGKAASKRTKKPPGRKNPDKFKEAHKQIRYYVRQKFAHIIAVFKSDSWAALLMISAYLVIVFSINLSATAIHPETLKGMAYMVLLYSGWRAGKQLLKEQAYIKYLLTMAGSTIVLIALSWYLQLQAAGLI